MSQTTYDLFGQRVVLPADHELPRLQGICPQYASNLGRVARAIHEVLPALTIVDVGGNVGDSVAIVRSQCDAPILTVEGHEPYLTYLRQNINAVPAVELEEAFVAGLRTRPKAGVVAVGGTARLVDAAGARSDEPAGHPELTLAQILERHPRFAASRLVKLDTDGMDVSIVLANLAYVERVHPVLFLEYDPALSAPPNEPTPALWEPLRRLGYRYGLLWENTGFYIGCVDVADPMTADEVDAAASGWATSRYFDLCLFHQDDRRLADRARWAEVVYARSAPRVGRLPATTPHPEQPLAECYTARDLGRAFLSSMVRRLTGRR